jgi:hypothetical protein
MKKKKQFKIPKPKEAIKIGISLGAISLGIGAFKKYSGGN